MPLRLENAKLCKIALPHQPEHDPNLPTRKMRQEERHAVDVNLFTLSSTQYNQKYMPFRQLKTYQSLQRRLTGNAKHPRSTNRQELRPGQKRIKSIRSEPQNPLKSHIYPINPARYAITAHTDK